MSICLWCDLCEKPYPDSDVDGQAMQMPVAKIENGVKVGISHTVERHRCGNCVRAERRRIERQHELAAAVENRADEPPQDRP